MADTRLQAVAAADHRPGRPSPGARRSGPASAVPVAPSVVRPGRRAVVAPRVMAVSVLLDGAVRAVTHVFAHPSRPSHPVSVRVDSALITGLPRSCRPSRIGRRARRPVCRPLDVRPGASWAVAAALRERGSMGTDRDSIDIVPH